MMLELDQSVKTRLGQKSINTLWDCSLYSSEELTNSCLSYSEAQTLNMELQNFGMRLRNHRDPKPVQKVLPAKAKELIAKVLAMEEVIWRYEELECVGVDKILCKRLENKDIFDPNHARSNFSKLMERILTFRLDKKSFVKHLIPHAERRLGEIKVVDSNIRVAVLGDKSGSMAVAVRSASVIASLLTVAFNADLKFFDDR
eukprot:UN31607